MHWVLAALALFAPTLLAWVFRRAHGVGTLLLGQVLLIAITAVMIGAAGEHVIRPPLPGVMSALWALGLTALFVLWLGPWLLGVPERLGLRGFEAGIDDLGRLPTPILVSAVVVNGFAEELLYRFVAFTLLIQATGNAWLTGTLVVAAGAVAHAPIWGLGPSLTVLISGAVLTAAYAVTGDIWAVIAAHVLTDLAGLVLPRLRARGGSQG